jgi:hypothetical protein
MLSKKMLLRVVQSAAKRLTEEHITVSQWWIFWNILRGVMALPPEISISVVRYLSALSIVDALQYLNERDGITTRGLG